MSDTGSTDTTVVGCQHCNERVKAEKTATGRIVLTPLGAGGGSITGIVMGRVTGIAGRMTMAATVPFGVVGGIIGGMGGYIVGEHYDHHKCPCCGEKLDIYE